MQWYNILNYYYEQDNTIHIYLRLTVYGHAYMYNAAIDFGFFLIPLKLALEKHIYIYKHTLALILKMIISFILIFAKTN